MESQEGATATVAAADGDPLTGLPRTGTFQAVLDERCRRAREANGSDPGYLVAILDVVGMRRINRDLGNDAGDELLRQVARRLVGCGYAELVARVGGDEFALFAQEVEAEEGGQWVRALRRNVLREPFELGGRRVDVEFHVSRRVGPPALGRDLLWEVQYDASIDGTRELWHRIDALQMNVTEVAPLVHENRRLRKNIEMLRDLAMRDPLTRLLNRRGMTERLEERPVPRALAFVDLDDLRLLNSRDELWEDGDSAITGVADRLREAFGDRNVARWGGDEYLVVSDSVPGEMADVLTRLLGQCLEELVVSGCPISFSAGVCGTGYGLRTARERAQRALKEAKARRATVVVDDRTGRPGPQDFLGSNW